MPLLEQGHYHIWIVRLNFHHFLRVGEKSQSWVAVDGEVKELPKGRWDRLRKEKEDNAWLATVHHGMRKRKYIKSLAHRSPRGEESAPPDQPGTCLKKRSIEDLQNKLIKLPLEVEKNSAAAAPKSYSSIFGSTSSRHCPVGWANSISLVDSPHVEEFSCLSR